MKKIWYLGLMGFFLNTQNIWAAFQPALVDNVLVAKLSDFKAEDRQTLEQAVSECSQCRGLVLDLRGNHSDNLDEALKIADLFLDEGLITSAIQTNDAFVHYFSASAGDILADKPIVILIDHATSGAAEILAAALSEQRRAILAGTDSNGMGNLPLNGVEAAFYAPSGTPIRAHGLKPALCLGVAVDQGTRCIRPADFAEPEDLDVVIGYIKNDF